LKKGLVVYHKSLSSNVVAGPGFEPGTFGL
jgi:hypothetical protein